MKKVVKRFGFTVIAALIIFTHASCVINMPDDKPSLDGYWVGLSNEVVRISGKTGKFHDLSNTTGGWGTAVYYDVIKVGDVKFRDLTKTGDRTWVGEQCSVSPYTIRPTSLTWSEAIFTLSDDGQSFDEYVYEHGRSYTWTKQ